MKPKPSSTAKRLERRFLELEESGEALAISVNRVFHQERILLTKRESWKPHDWVEDKARLLTASRCGLAIEDVAPLVKQGATLLKR